MSFARLAARLLLSMSFQEAKEILGLPTNQAYTPEDLIKAYRRKAIENHPDRGGDPQKMVEVNVAKEILDGKRRDDRTVVKRPQESEEVVRRRRNEIRKEQNIGQVKDARDRAVEASKRVYDSVGYILGGYRLDFREYLNSEFATAVDKLHDEADLAWHKGESNASKTALALTQALLGKAMKVASKLGALKTALKVLKGSDLSIRNLRQLTDDCDKFFQTVSQLREQSGELMRLITTSEDVPFLWDQIYSPCHSMIRTFDENYKDFQRINPKLLKNAEDEIERCIDSVQVKIDSEYGVGTASTANWSEWEIPADFNEVLAKIERAKSV
jgi:hypothetical protein